MKKKYILLILFICLLLTGCNNNMDREEIDKIGNLVNGTE